MVSRRRSSPPRPSLKCAFVVAADGKTTAPRPARCRSTSAWNSGCVGQIWYSAPIEKGAKSSTSPPISTTAMRVAAATTSVTLMFETANGSASAEGEAIDSTSSSIAASTRRTDGARRVNQAVKSFLGEPIPPLRHRHRMTTNLSIDRAIRRAVRAGKHDPGLTLVSEPTQGGTLATRTFIPHRCHDAIGVLSSGVRSGQLPPRHR